MARPFSLLLLLVGLTAPAGAQIASGVLASSVPAHGQAGSVGLAAGLNVWPPALYCAGPMTGTVQPLDPRAVLERVQLAAKCGVRLIVVPPRRFLTLSRQTKGGFSVDNAKALMDQYASELPPDTLRKYRATLLGMNLADDYNCAKCWGGLPITRSQIVEWARYARAKLPGLPLGVRVEPDWVADEPGLAPLLDYTWAQYQTKKGDPQAYFDKAASTAKSLGLQVVMGVNVQDCYGPNSGPCSAADLVKYGTVAVSHPASCAFLSWKYDAQTWDAADIRAGWDKLLGLAKARASRDCRRQGGGV
jgi:hypothetical protein